MRFFLITLYYVFLIIIILNQSFIKTALVDSKNIHISSKFANKNNGRALPLFRHISFPIIYKLRDIYLEKKIEEVNSLLNVDPKIWSASVSIFEPLYENICTSEYYSKALQYNGPIVANEISKNCNR